MRKTESICCGKGKLGSRVLLLGGRRQNEYHNTRGGTPKPHAALHALLCTPCTCPLDWALTVHANLGLVAFDTVHEALHPVPQTALTRHLYCSSLRTLQLETDCGPFLPEDLPQSMPGAANRGSLNRAIRTELLAGNTCRGAALLLRYCAFPQPPAPRCEQAALY